MLKNTPAVFAVGENYQITVPISKPSIFWIEIDGNKYFDEQNGIMRSLCLVHRVTVPIEILNKAGHYTVCEKEIIDRRPYFPQTEETVKTEFNFYPLPNENIKIYHIADTHGLVEAPVKAANSFGRVDLLVLNGDIPDHSGDIKNYDAIFQIVDQITHGERPTVFARGNHDLRGQFAECMEEYIPTLNGNTYYTFRLGALWGIVLDCGEDKDDSNAEYGFTVACHPFRQRQTEFIKKIIENRKTEYEAEGITCKMVIVHNPFTYVQSEPFDIEKEIFKEWAGLLKEFVKPDIMLSGHLHKAFVSKTGSEYDHLGQPCTLIVGSDMQRDGYHLGCGITINNKCIKAVFCDSLGKAFDEIIL